jgi:hypothetical protein
MGISEVRDLAKYATQKNRSNGSGFLICADAY